MKTSYQNTHKGFVIPAIIAIVVLAIAAGVYIYGTKPRPVNCCHGEQYSQIPLNETASSTGWKTYVDQVDGFSIDYPSDWIVSRNLIDDYASPTFCPSTMADSSGKRCNIAPPEEGQAPPIKLVQGYDGNVPSDQRFLAKDGSIVYGLYLGDKKYQSVFDRMASSSKLVVSPVDKISWKTYTNSEYGFQIQYPLIGKKQDVETPNDKTFFEFKDWNDQCGCFVGMFFVSVNKNDAGLSLTDWIEKNIDNSTGLLMKNNNFVMSKDQNMEIAKFVGILPDGFDEPVMLNYIARSSVTGYIYTIAIDGQSNDLDQYGLVAAGQYDRLAEKLMSTFKIINDKSVKY